MTIPTVIVLTVAAGISLQLQLEQSVGVLTSEKRPVWHELRAQLCRDQANAHTYHGYTYHGYTYHG